MADVNLYDMFSGCDEVLDRLYDFAIEHKLSARMVDTIAAEVHTQHRGDYVHLERRTFLEGLDYEAKLRAFDQRLLEQYVLPELKREYMTMAAHGRPDLDYDVDGLVEMLEAEDTIEVNFSDLDAEVLERLEGLDEWQR
ncbi:MAG: hypothetical protein ABIA62_08195 [Candidatus Woesearchaeota archaeon]